MKIYFNKLEIIRIFNKGDETTNELIYENMKRFAGYRDVNITTVDNIDGDCDEQTKEKLNQALQEGIRTKNNTRDIILITQ